MHLTLKPFIISSSLSVSRFLKVTNRRTAEQRVRSSLVTKYSLGSKTLLTFQNDLIVVSASPEFCWKDFIKLFGE